MNKKIISASILSADFAKLAEDVQNVVKAGVGSIHFDVMDFNYVPNLTFGALVCQALRDAGITACIDVHLMVANPQDFVKPFADAGANLITFHPETVDHVDHLLQQIRETGMQAGLAFNPNQPVSISDDMLRKLDMILMMSVYPGFGGQGFIGEVLAKITTIRQRLTKTKSKACLGVDGGIKVNNIAKVAEAGADFFVVGSGLFSAKDYKKRVAELKHAIAH